MLVKNAQDSGQILLIMVNNLLDASKIDADKFELNLETAQYRQVI